MTPRANSFIHSFGNDVTNQAGDLGKQLFEKVCPFCTRSANELLGDLVVDGTRDRIGGTNLVQLFEVVKSHRRVLNECPGGPALRRPVQSGLSFTLLLRFSLSHSRAAVSKRLDLDVFLVWLFVRGGIWCSLYVDIEFVEPELRTEAAQTVVKGCTKYVLVTRSFDVRCQTLNDLTDEIRDDLLRLLGWLREVIELSFDVGDPRLYAQHHVGKSGKKLLVICNTHPRMPQTYSEGMWSERLRAI
jgi:hypothetical protein